MPVSDMTQPMFLPGFLPEPPQTDDTTASSETSERGSSPDPPTVSMARVSLSTRSRFTATQTSDSGPTPIASTAPSLRTQSGFYMTGVSAVSSSTLVVETPLDCTICLDRLATDVVKLLACAHMFHADCIITWFDGSAPRDGSHRGTCPNCRCELYQPDRARIPALAPEAEAGEFSLLTDDVDDEGLWEDDDDHGDDDDEEFDYDGSWDSDAASTDQDTRRFSQEIRNLNASHPARLSRGDFLAPADLFAHTTGPSYPFYPPPDPPTHSPPPTSPSLWPEHRAPASNQVRNEPPAHRATRIPRLIAPTAPPQDTARPRVDSAPRPPHTPDQESSTIDLIHRVVAQQRDQLARRVHDLHRTQPMAGGAPRAVGGQHRIPPLARPHAEPRRTEAQEPGLRDAEHMARLLAHLEAQRRGAVQTGLVGEAGDGARETGPGDLASLLREGPLSGEEDREVRFVARRVLGRSLYAPRGGARGEGRW